MKVLLINPESPTAFGSWHRTFKLTGAKALSPPLGLLTVAGLLPQEWEFRLKDLNTRPIGDEDRQWADVIMITGMLIQKSSLLALVRRGKQFGKTVVVGGPYATSVPEAVLEAGCDLLVRGEAENTAHLLISALLEGRRKEVFESSLKPDLSLSPIPRFDLLNMTDYVSLGIQTCRGCPFDCEFCDIVNLFGRKQRHKTPDQVIRELEAIYNLGWRGDVFINDDNFIGSGKHARALLQRLIPWLKSRGEPFIFSTQASVNLGQDPEMIDLMTAANFVSVLLGIETPDEDVLEGIHKRQNISNPLLESVRNVTRNGLSVLGTFIIGFDGEKPGAGERIAAFVEASNIPVAMINTLQAVPNTRLWDRLKREGRLLEGRTSGGTILDTPNFIPTRPPSEIMEEYVKAWDHVYEPSRFLARTYRHFLDMRPTRRALAMLKGQPPPDESRREKEPFFRTVRSLLGLCRLVWWQGLASGHARQFRRQVAGMRKRNPSRMTPYLKTCALGENMFDLRKEIHRRASSCGLDGSHGAYPSPMPGRTVAQETCVAG